MKLTETAVSTPIIETIEMDFKAGCLAKIRAPIPSNVVITDRMMDA